ncbi:dihydroxyacetone kinase phosphoryl donor subunit DhaM [Gandjariella thermophila]|uniref:Phosphocarrier protein HPr n=1 Tax=Gandjariella thermophila TaxID=1931992 RepID=A0A4D4JA27_9PSEU|nr:dihydroxyacetone kinase phosphoryl donor subunit DhaM [Gandjariella thermophila]GDY32424.1 PTS sugar transporter subunit IIA [Gandjariella thermophila]
MSRVGLVIVAHSARLAEGVVELAAQMAPEVTVLAAGGMDDGGLGTSFDKVTGAVAEADSGAGVLLLYDLGSAQMTAELAVESLADPDRARLVNAPLVEGAVAAAVAAQGGADLPAVASAAEAAGAGAEAAAEPAPAGPTESTDVLLTNEVGLHARPAALLARSIAHLDAEVTVRYGDQEVDARSVLALMGLGARAGDTVTVTATGRDAKDALRRITNLAERRFDE